MQAACFGRLSFDLFSLLSIGSIPPEKDVSGCDLVDVLVVAASV
jgi:hypothetical protein